MNVVFWPSALLCSLHLYESFVGCAMHTVHACVRGWGEGVGLVEGGGVCVRVCVRVFANAEMHSILIEKVCLRALCCSLKR